MVPSGKSLRRFLGAALLGLGVCVPAVAGPDAAPEPRKAVLILHVEQPNLPWVAALSVGMFSTFDAAPASARPMVRTDYLEAIRNPDRAAAQLTWFRERYRGENFDAIIAVSGPALDFVLPLRDELWPAATVILLSPTSTLPREPLPPGVVVVQAAFQEERTIDLARSIFPDTRRIAYVSEDGTGNARWRRDLGEQGLDFVDLTGLRLEELEERIRTLPPNTVVFFESFHFDGTGRHFVPRDVLARVARFSNSPFVGVSATMVGFGLTAGWVLDYAAIGAETARIALRILGGETIEGRPDPATFSRLEVDDRELRRWHVPSSRVPAGATVRFREPTLWNDHRGTVIAVLTALILQAALIVSLLAERRRRGLAQSLTKATLASLPGQVAVLDGEGRVVQANQNWETFATAGEGSPAGGVATGGDYLDAWRRARASVGPLAEAGVRLIQDVLQGDTKGGTLEYSLDGADGDRWFEMRVEELRRPGRGAVVVQVDVTQRRRAVAEARMRDREIAHLNRVGAIGELASSLAHELGQPLGAILANAQAARRLLSRPSPDLAEVQASVNDIIEDDQRAGQVVQRVRALLRGEETPRDTVDMNEVVGSVLRMVAGEASLRGVSIEPLLASPPPLVFGDRVQLEQVFLNLILNGLDAVADRAPGQREVHVSTNASNGSVAVSVRDTGPGIQSPDLELVFEPFFTTKDHGLGMGLSICRTIVEAHGGEIRAENPAAGGAAFRCAFPAAESPAS